ncbi:cell wall integrity and stress response component 3-like [Helianthus annuus]|uniref:cell wall integrity and stress response component 3-like n=1 Tax=Helianthus annuus TaxID=4232 RepID=UPI000B8EE9A3|nr:cell wall integrity and stress response component 3-like [Helianthus annuus]
MSCGICFNPCTIFERVDDAKKGEKNDFEENLSVTSTETYVKEKEKGGEETLKIQVDDEDTQMRIIQSQVNSAGLKTTADIKRVRDESRALVEKKVVLQKEKEEVGTSLKKSPVRKTRQSTTTASKTKPVTTSTTTSVPTKSLTPPPLTTYVTQITTTNTTSTLTTTTTTAIPTKSTSPTSKTSSPPPTPLAAILYQRRRQR